MKSKTRAQSIMEYMTLIAFILSAMFIFQHYIKRAVSGNWKKAGDVFAHGRQYDPRAFGGVGEFGGTLECVWSTRVNAWISMQCFESDAACVLCSAPNDPSCPVACLTTCNEFNNGSMCAG